MVSVPWIVVIVVSTVALAALIMLCFIVPEWRRRVRELKEKVARSGEKLKYQEKRHQRRLAHMAEQQQQQQQQGPPPRVLSATFPVGWDPGSPGLAASASASRGEGGAPAAEPPATASYPAKKPPSPPRKGSGGGPPAAASEEVAQRSGDHHHAAPPPLQRPTELMLFQAPTLVSPLRQTPTDPPLEGQARGFAAAVPPSSSDVAAAASAPVGDSDKAHAFDNKPEGAVANDGAKQQQQQQPESDRQQRAAAAVPVQQQDQQQLHPRYERREAPHTRAASPAGSASLCDLSTITKDVSQQRLENDSPFAHAGGTAAAAAGYSPDAGKNPLSDLRQQGSGGGGGSKGAQAAASMQGRQKATSVKGAGVPAAAPSKAQQRSRVYFVVRVHRAPGAHSANHARKYSYSEEPSPSPAQQAAESAADGDGACIRLVPDRPFRTLFNHAALKKYATHVFGMEGGPVRYPIIRGEYEVFVVLRSEGELQAGVQHSGGGGGGGSGRQRRDVHKLHDLTRTPLDFGMRQDEAYQPGMEYAVHIVEGGSGFEPTAERAPAPAVAVPVVPPPPSPPLLALTQSDSGYEDGGARAAAAAAVHHPPGTPGSYLSYDSVQRRERELNNRPPSELSATDLALSPPEYADPAGGGLAAAAAHHPSAAPLLPPPAVAAANASVLSGGSSLMYTRRPPPPDYQSAASAAAPPHVYSPSYAAGTGSSVATPPLTASSAPGALPVVGGLRSGGGGGVGGGGAPRRITTPGASSRDAAAAASASSAVAAVAAAGIVVPAPRSSGLYQKPAGSGGGGGGGSGSGGDVFPPEGEEGAAELPLCPVDEACLQINDEEHYTFFKHSCRIPNCDQADDPGHTAFFSHPAPATPQRFRNSDQNPVF